MAPVLPVGYTPEEVAASLKISPDLVRDLILAGKIGCIRASRRGVRLLDKHVAELIAYLEVPAKPPPGPTPSNPFGATSRSINRRRKSNAPIAGRGQTP